MFFQSGVYSGNSPGTALSPFGSSVSSSGDPINSNTPTNNYMVAEGTGGTVTITYTSSQTSLALLWGTVDTNVGRNVTVTAGGSDTITGADIINAVNSVAGSVILANETYDVGVVITGLGAFTSVTMSNSLFNAPAFEFDIAAVPAPIIGSGLSGLLTVGGLLLGAGRFERNRKRRPPESSIPHTA